MTSDPSALQRIASDPSRSVWVSASAGSGKTKVLTERVLRLLLTGCSPSRILCITYTKAAAAEMQNRIHGKLAAWVVMEEEALRAALAELAGQSPAAETLRRARRLFALLLEDAPGLRIQTFHSFCQSLLARFPLEAGVAPHFTLIEEQDAADLLEEARTRLLQAALSGEDKRLREAVEEVTVESGEWGFTELVKEIISRRRIVERILARRGGAVAHTTRLYAALGLPYYGIDEASLTTSVLAMNEARRDRLARAADVLLEGTKQDSTLAGKLRAYLASEAVEELISALLTREGTPRQRLMTAALQKAYPDHHAFLQRVAADCVTLRDRLNALSVARLSDAAVIIAESLFALYTSMKRARGYLDYDDLILKTRALLGESEMTSWVLYKLDGGIDHLLIDEAQDTSPEQWELKAALEDEFFAGQGARTGGRTLFVVGDEKQSIYRFQGAEPEGFARQQARTAEKTATAREEFTPVPMNTSFRSAPAVLKAVDAVFAGEVAAAGITREVGSVEHIPFRATASGRVELWPLFGWEERGEPEPWPVPDMRRDVFSPQMQLAQRMAGTISGWIKEGRWRAGDILVLVRSRGEFIHYLSRALKDRQVPVAGLDRMRITDHLAVKDLLALAQFLLLPEDDYTLACLLKSPLYNLSEDDLFTLCHGRGDTSVWEQLKGPGVCPAAEEELSFLLSRADYGSPHRLFAELLYARGGRERFMARMGEEVEEVLDAFMELALEFERLHTPTLLGFLSWMARGAGEIKRDMEQGIDAVRIMTVHGAKGLEAPVVFLPDSTGQVTLRDKLYFLSTEEDDLMLCSPRSEVSDEVTENLRGERKAEEEEESHRLLYVAMTRARDELYVAGCKPRKKDIPSESWYRLVQEGLRRLPGVVETEEGGLLLAETGEEELAGKERGEQAEQPPLPDYARTLPMQEAPQEPLRAPSHLDETVAEKETATPPLGVGGAAERGILIHRLLQLLSGLEPSRREEAASRYLARTEAAMPQEGQDRIISEVLAVMTHPEFSEAFSPDALAEAPLVGMVEGRRLAGQVDRLIVRPDTVTVIDFKTGVPPKNNVIPASYKKQMEAYTALLAEIYPGRTIRAALLYTSTPLLVRIA